MNKPHFLLSKVYLVNFGFNSDHFWPVPKQQMSIYDNQCRGVGNPVVMDWGMKPRPSSNP
jgi:hypothetical protein